MNKKSETAQVKMPSGVDDRIVEQSKALNNNMKTNKNTKIEIIKKSLSGALISIFVCMLSPALFLIGSFPFLLIFSSELNSPQFVQFIVWIKWIWIFWLYGSIMALLVSFGLYLVNSREEDCY